MRRHVRAVLEGLPFALALSVAMAAVLFGAAYLPYLVLPLVAAASVVWLSWMVGTSAEERRVAERERRVFEEVWHRQK